MMPMLPHRFFEGGGLPSSHSAGGFSVALNTDFRVWLRYEFLQKQDSLSQEEQVRACVALCCKEFAPGAPMSFLVDSMVWFHSCADAERMVMLNLSAKAREDMAARKRHSCRFWDFYQLWASFKQQYDIDLYACGELHWWEFKLLEAELKADTPYSRLHTLRSITRAEFLQEEGRLKRDRESKWGGVILDQMYAALPGEE